MSTELFRLDGKVALVTGASSGLGAHFARVLAEAGANVALAARRVDRIKALADELQTYNVKTHGVAMDVTDSASVSTALEEVQNALGVVTVLVNNAGVARTKAFTEATEEDWDFVLEANLKGVWRVAHDTAKRMMDAKVPGSIINIASIIALGVGPHLSAYATSKAAVAHLTKSMATELFGAGIRVNAICPGYFRTEMNDDYFDTQEGQDYLRRIPPKRLGQLDELTGPLLLLASDASSFMTGTLIPVDGGHSIRLV